MCTHSTACSIYLILIIQYISFDLAFTHLIMEGIAVVTNRELSQSHPIFRLLAPHFLFLLAINRYMLSLHCVEQTLYMHRDLTTENFFLLECQFLL